MRVNELATCQTTTTTKSNSPYSNQSLNLWVDATVAAHTLGISTDQLYRAVRAGRCSVRWVRVGNLLRFSARDLGLFEDQNEEAEQSDKTLARSSDCSAF